jgi:hypothetical protein
VLPLRQLLVTYILLPSYMIKWQGLSRDEPTLSGPQNPIGHLTGPLVLEARDQINFPALVHIVLPQETQPIPEPVPPRVQVLLVLTMLPLTFWPWKV